MGSAGDVHPLVGLGEALAARGHQVTVLTNAYFQSLIERVGLGYVELSTEEEFHRLANHPDLWHPRKAFFYIARHGIHRFMRRQYELITELVVPNQTVVVNSCLGFGARIAPKKADIISRLVDRVLSHLPSSPSTHHIRTSQHLQIICLKSLYYLHF